MIFGFSPNKNRFSKFSSQNLGYFRQTHHGPTYCQCEVGGSGFARDPTDLRRRRAVRAARRGSGARGTSTDPAGMHTIRAERFRAVADAIESKKIQKTMKNHEIGAKPHLLGILTLLQPGTPL